MSGGREGVLKGNTGLVLLRPPSNGPATTVDRRCDSVVLEGTVLAFGASEGLA